MWRSWPGRCVPIRTSDPRTERNRTMTAETSRAHVLVEPADLAAELQRDAPPLLLDVRWSLDEPDGWPKYAAGHLPGARFVDMEVELTGTDRPFREGRHPLPAISDLQEAA